MLPRALASTSGGGVQLTVVDILPLSRTALFGADGTAVVSFDQVDSGQLWLVEAGSIRTTSTSSTRAALWAGPRLMDGSDRGSFDFTDRNSPILVASGEQLQIVWTGGTPGAAATFDGQYQLLTRG